jgi:tRNA uridine 5-carboxymethylaminomethyl modification enzyme
MKDYPNLTIQSGSVSDLLLNDDMTQEEHTSMVKKGAIQVVKGVKMGKISMYFYITKRQ